MRALLTGVALLAIVPAASAKSSIDRAQDVEPAAPPAKFRVGKPDHGARIDRMTVALWVKEAETIATIGIDIDGADKTMRDVTIPLELPAGTRPTAMEVTIGDTHTHAFALDAVDARKFYQDTVAKIIDPALLEKKSATAFALRVFPIVNKGKQHVDITLVLPPSTRLVLEAAGHVIGKLDVTSEGRQTTSASFTRLAGARTIALPEPHRGIFESAPERVAVDWSTSLVAGRSNISGLDPRITVRIGPMHGGFRQQRSVDKTIVRSRIKLAMPRITYCYERELLHDPKLEGQVVVQFLLQRSGKVEVKDVSGTLTDDKVRSCLVGVFESLEYPETDGDTLVNYPLNFRAVAW